MLIKMQDKNRMYEHGKMEQIYVCRGFAGYYEIEAVIEGHRIILARYRLEDSAVHVFEEMGKALIDGLGAYMLPSDAVLEIEEGWIDCSEKQPPQPIMIDIEDAYFIKRKSDPVAYPAEWNGKVWRDAECSFLEDVVAWQPIPDYVTPSKAIARMRRIEWGL